jgi:hypothetical protein
MMVGFPVPLAPFIGEQMATVRDPSNEKALISLARAQEQRFGKGEVESSIPSSSTMISLVFCGNDCTSFRCR